MDPISPIIPPALAERTQVLLLFLHRVIVLQAWFRLFLQRFLFTFCELDSVTSILNLLVALKSPSKNSGHIFVES